MVTAVLDRSIYDAGQERVTRVDGPTRPRRFYSTRACMVPNLSSDQRRVVVSWVSDRRGFTMIETVLVLVIIGLVASFAFPLVRGGQDQASVRSATDAIVAMHATARGVATQRAQRTVFDLNAGVIAIRSTNPVTGAIDSVGSTQDLTDRFTVSIASTRDSLVFDPRGLGTETSPTYIYVRRGNSADTLQVTRLGRVLK